MTQAHVPWIKGSDHRMQDRDLGRHRSIWEDSSWGRMGLRLALQLKTITQCFQIEKNYQQWSAKTNSVLFNWLKSTNIITFCVTIFFLFSANWEQVFVLVKSSWKVSSASVLVLKQSAYLLILFSCNSDCQHDYFLQLMNVSSERFQSIWKKAEIFIILLENEEKL